MLHFFCNLSVGHFCTLGGGARFQGFFLHNYINPHKNGNNDPVQENDPFYIFLTCGDWFLRSI